MVRIRDNGADQHSEGANLDYFTIYGKALTIFNRKYLNNSLVNELVELLSAKDTRSLRALAVDLIPDECQINIVVAIKIIHIAMQKAIAIYSESESLDKTEVTASRNSRVKSAANQKRKSGQVMLEASGKVPYSDEEMALVMALMYSPDYAWTYGTNIDSPNWSLIALKVNSVFRNRRSGKSICDQIKTMRFNGDKRLDELKDLPIVNLVAESQYYLESFIIDLIIQKRLYTNYAQQVLTIVTDLTDLRSYWEIVRDVMPEEFKYGESAANQIISTIIELLQEDPNVNFDLESFEHRKLAINSHRSRAGHNADRMLENQGAIRFTRKEFQRFLELRRDERYIRQDGPQAGRTNYTLVAETLNAEFSGTRPAREPKNLSDIIRAYRQNNNKKPWQYPNIDDLNISVEDIVNAYFHEVES